MIDGYWLSVRDSDPRAVGMYARHYSASKRIGISRWLRSGISGPGESMILMTTDCSALWLWRTRLESLDGRRQAYDDGQRGVMCSVFRNEGFALSSDLIREAVVLAWKRWPNTRLFTYVADAKIRSTNPGYCFKVAGWRACGRNADSSMTILELLPESARGDVQFGQLQRQGTAPLATAGPAAQER